MMRKKIKNEDKMNEKDKQEEQIVNVSISQMF